MTRLYIKKLYIKKMEKFHGTIAVVAGASTGIGLGIVKKLLETRELEVVGFSRREMELSNPNFRNVNSLWQHKACVIFGVNA